MQTKNYSAQTLAELEKTINDLQARHINIDHMVMSQTNYDSLVAEGAEFSCLLVGGYGGAHINEYFQGILINVDESLDQGFTIYLA